MDLKYKTLDTKINNNHKLFEGHVDRVKAGKIEIDNRFDDMEDLNRLEHKEILVKSDMILEKLSNFMIYVEQKLNHK